VTDIDTLRDRLRAFTQERDWEQFHQPKNLLLALVGEVGEVAELLQWLEPSEIKKWISTPENMQATSDELADVFAYLLQLADSLKIDLAVALNAKIDSNEAKYPVDLARGRSTKYDRL
jgi:NTP pyrophosphatase (non-canonical NTP hydrolase)